MAMTLRLTDAEAEVLRRRARLEQRPMQELVRQAIREYVESHSRNHALVDGNKRLALAATIAFYGINGRRLTLTNDEAYELIMNVAAGKLDSVDDITAILAVATGPRP